MFGMLFQNQLKPGEGTGQVTCLLASVKPRYKRCGGMPDVLLNPFLQECQRLIRFALRKRGGKVSAGKLIFFVIQVSGEPVDVQRALELAFIPQLVSQSRERKAVERLQAQ